MKSQVLSLVVIVCAVLVEPTAVYGQQCPSISISQCRAVAPQGQLLHNPNSAGRRVWTTNCGQPNTTKRGKDPLCEQIASCPASGAFGKFLRAVTFDCEVKHFNGYFGLDGMTYGILDWTSDNLPQTFAAYQRRNSAKFQEIFGPLDLPIKNGCLDPKWACESNKQGKLMCDAGFRDAFAKGLHEADFQKAQIDLARAAYESRVKRYEALGLQSEYGNTAMAVVANNLLRTEECRPATWKKACAPQSDERKLVDCMLEQYVEHSCRGSARGSKERADAIRKIFANSASSTVIHPSSDDIVSCSNGWGTSPR